MNLPRSIAFLLFFAVLLTGAALGAPAPEAAAGVLSVQPESLLYCHAGSEESELGDLCADAALEAAGAQLALIPAAVLKNDLPVGPLTWYDITNAVDEAPLVTASLTPQQLYALLEGALSALVLDAENETLLWEASESDGFLQVAGISLTIDGSAPVGERAYRITLGETALSRGDAETQLSIVTTAAVASGDYGYLFPGEAAALGQTLAEALSGYLTRNEITAITTGRIRTIGTTNSTLVNRLPGWALGAVLAIIALCCIFFRGKERASKPLRPMQEGETKKRF